MSSKVRKKSETIVKCKNIYKYYGKGTTLVKALRGVNLEVKKGELRMLVGPSGSGKTTLISVIGGILTQDKGECLVNNVDLNHLADQEKTKFRGKNIGFSFQTFNLIPTLTTDENVSLPLIILGTPKAEALEKARKLLSDFGLSDKVGVNPPELSGGQQQRVAIARSLIHDPLLVVCDEPTSFLDIDTGQKIMDLIRDIVDKKHITFIVITHDTRILPYADHINHLEEGVITKD